MRTIRKFFQLLLCLFAAGTILGAFAACGASIGAEKPPTDPPSQIQPGAQSDKPATARATSVPPTFVPGDPNQPVSNQTPVTPAQSNRVKAQIRGRVTNAQGEPIARARFAFTNSSVPMPEMAYLTKTDGTFVLNVPRGTYTLVVNADGYAPQERALDTQTNAELQADFVLQKQP